MLHKLMVWHRERELQEAWKRVWGSDAGRMALADLFRRTGVLEISHRFSIEDPNGRDSAFREGQRSVALEILTYLKTTPVELAEIIRQSEQEYAEANQHQTN